jgi:hypothetical protein
MKWVVETVAKEESGCVDFVHVVWLASIRRSCDLHNFHIGSHASLTQAKSAASFSLYDSSH